VSNPSFGLLGAVGHVEPYDSPTRSETERLYDYRVADIGRHPVQLTGSCRREAGLGHTGVGESSPHGQLVPGGRYRGGTTVRYLQQGGRSRRDLDALILDRDDGAGLRNLGNNPGRGLIRHGQVNLEMADTADNGQFCVGRHHRIETKSGGRFEEITHSVAFTTGNNHDGSHPAMMAHGPPPAELP
jgi:hypothetical protein